MCIVTNRIILIKTKVKPRVKIKILLKKYKGMLMAMIRILIPPEEWLKDRVVDILYKSMNSPLLTKEVINYNSLC